MKNLIIVCGLSALLSNSSFACMVEQPLTEEIKNKADLVIIGKAIAYTPRPKFDMKKRGPWKPAIIRFKVEKTISGSKADEIEVYWINATYGESSSLQEFIQTYGERTRVGIEHADKSDKFKQFKDKPWIVQGPCTKPFMWSEK